MPRLTPRPVGDASGIPATEWANAYTLLIRCEACDGARVLDDDYCAVCLGHGQIALTSPFELLRETGEHTAADVIALAVTKAPKVDDLCVSRYAGTQGPARLAALMLGPCFTGFQTRWGALDGDRFEFLRRHAARWILEFTPNAAELLRMGVAS